MNRGQKQAWVEELHGGLKGAEVMLISHYSGLTVAEISDLRGKVKAAGAKFKVTKNKLAVRALGETPFSGLVDMFKGPTAIVYSKDPVSAAKALMGFAKDNEKLVVLGGLFGEHTMDAKGVKALSEMPSLDELRAKILMLLQEPARRIVTIMKEPANRTARVIKANADKQPQGAG